MLITLPLRFHTYMLLHTLATLPRDAVIDAHALCQLRYITFSLRR